MSASFYSGVSLLLKLYRIFFVPKATKKKTFLFLLRIVMNLPSFSYIFHLPTLSDYKKKTNLYLRKYCTVSVRDDTLLCSSVV